MFFFSAQNTNWLGIQEYSATVLCRGRVSAHQLCLWQHWDLEQSAQKEMGRICSMAKDLYLFLHAMGLQKLKKEGKVFFISILGYALVISSNKRGRILSRKGSHFYRVASSLF